MKSNNLLRFSLQLQEDGNLVTEIESIHVEEYQKLAKEMGMADEHVGIVCAAVLFLKTNIEVLEQDFTKHMRSL
jgi:uncharacterized protein YdbL (DUF1318 family)